MSAFFEGAESEMSLIREVKKKREFSGLPDSIVLCVLDSSDGDVKKSRALLRKYFGAFLTNRVLKGAGDLLGMHMSSKKRDYEKFYFEIFSGIDSVGSVIDLGCGANGFSYGFLKKELGDVDYVGVEAVGQLVDLTNDYFEREGFGGKVVCSDLFDVDSVVKILKVARRPRVVFLFQVIDALEGLRRNFSKEFLLAIARECEWIILSLSSESLGGGKRFESRRKWLMDFLGENFVIDGSLASEGEEILILKNKK